MIEITNLYKSYSGGKQALQDINLTINNGIVGLLGPNGAGKTTLMRILATLIRPTSGVARVFGFDVRDRRCHKQIRALLGYLPQGTGLHMQFSLDQNLDFFGLLKNMKDRVQRQRHIDIALERTGLTYVRRERTETLSGGMLRRLGIAVALLNNPRLIIVDEPTSGLDPAERMRFRNVLAGLAEDRIILLSTHIVEDIQQVGNVILVIRQGRLLFNGSVTDLIKYAQPKLWSIEQDALHTLDISGYTLLGLQLDQGKLVQRLLANQKPTEQAVPASPTLEDAYLAIMSEH